MIDQKLIFDESIFVFETVMRVRNTEIDVGQFLTLESLTTLLTESRKRFLYSKGIKEINTSYHGLIIDNLQLNMFSRVRAREELLFEVGVERLSHNNGDIATKVTRMSNGSIVAKARQHFINYDYRLNKTVSLNNSTKEALER